MTDNEKRTQRATEASLRARKRRRLEKLAAEIRAEGGIVTLPWEVEAA